MVTGSAKKKLKYANIEQKQKNKTKQNKKKKSKSVPNIDENKFPLLHSARFTFVRVLGRAEIQGPQCQNQGA